MAELAKAKEAAAKQAAEQQRLVEQAKAKDEAAKQAAEQQRLAELAKAKEAAAKQAAEQQRLADLAAAKATKGPAAASKEPPFVNSLRMKFLPFGITTGKRPVLFSIWETRRQDYEAYAAAISGVDTSWKNANYEGQPVGHGDDHPVVYVSWEDAMAFCAWLTKLERDSGSIPQDAEYRLPTDVEWSWAAGIGEKEGEGKTPEEKDMKLADVYQWATAWPPPKGAGNYCGQETKGKFGAMIDRYDDGYATTAPVGRFAANRYGLYDLGGNVWEWCGDYFDGKSDTRELRGGSWNINAPDCLLSSYRNISSESGYRLSDRGFRCVLVWSAR